MALAYRLIFFLLFSLQPLAKPATGILPASLGIRPGSVRYPSAGEKKALAYLCIAVVLGVSSYAVYITYLYRNKGRINKKKMILSAVKDPAWNHDQIIAHAKKLYIELQEARTKGNLDSLKDEVSHSFFRTNIFILNAYQRTGMRNVVEEVVINDASVVYFDDYIDNDKDSVAVLLKGNRKDYFIRKNTSARSWQPDSFTDVLIFTRNNDRWMLDEIVNNPDFYQVTKPKNVIES